MLLGGYGGVVWAQQTVPSSMAALIITVGPRMVLYDWLLFRSRRPSLPEVIGLILGFGGTVSWSSTSRDIPFPSRRGTPSGWWSSSSQHELEPRSPLLPEGPRRPVESPRRGHADDRGGVLDPLLAGEEQISLKPSP
ncbi:hypothetical protein MASR2M79_01620 [Aminivibrio sp.]